MTAFWKRRWGRLDLATELRAYRPEPRPELVAALAARVHNEPRRRRAGSFRLVLAGGLTAGMLAAVAAVGGISYAASAAQQVAKVVKKAVGPSGASKAVVVQGISSGRDQYQPGFGFGDPNHNHTGPPGLQRQGGAAAPPLRAVLTRDGKARIVSTRINIDEQANLSIFVLVNGKKLLLTQTSKRGGSNVGQGVKGPQTKVFRYLVLVPRSGIPLLLRIPANLLRQGDKGTIVVLATDPDGNQERLKIPFTV